MYITSEHSRLYKDIRAKMIPTSWRLVDYFLTPTSSLRFPIRFPSRVLPHILTFSSHREGRHLSSTHGTPHHWTRERTAPTHKQTNGPLRVRLVCHFSASWQASTRPTPLIRRSMHPLPHPPPPHTRSNQPNHRASSPETSPLTPPSLFRRARFSSSHTTGPGHASGGAIPAPATHTMRAGVAWARRGPGARPTRTTVWVQRAWCGS